MIVTPASPWSCHRSTQATTQIIHHTTTATTSLQIRCRLHARPAAAQLYFGQTLVQYDRLDWRIIETEHFLVHYYPVEHEAALDAARMSERGYARLAHPLRRSGGEGGDGDDKAAEADRPCQR